MRLRLRTPLARKNLTHDVRRLVTALCGIAFAVVLMFMETGFENALFDSTIQIIKKLDGQVVIASKAEYYLLAGETFPRERVYQARSCPDVAGVYPLYMDIFSAMWKPPDAKAYPIRVLAFEPGDPVFSIPEVNARAAVLRQPETAMIDAKSKSKFAIPGSPAELLRQRGAELCGRSIRLVGSFELGTDFANDGNVLLSAANFARYFPYRVPGGDPLGRVDLAVVHVRPGADPEAVAEWLRRHLPDDVNVFTRQGFIDNEIGFWSESTPIGYVFMMGTMVGFVVGVIICYQVIYSGISDYMSEFATLKAMGYPNRYFVGLVLQQSLYLSVLSFLPGLAVSLLLYHMLAHWTGLLMILNFRRAILVFGLTALMCVVSGCLAIRKVLAADPAELF